MEATLIPLGSHVITIYIVDICTKWSRSIPVVPESFCNLAAHDLLWRSASLMYRAESFCKLLNCLDSIHEHELFERIAQHARTLHRQGSRQFLPHWLHRLDWAWWSVLIGLHWRQLFCCHRYLYTCKISVSAAGGTPDFINVEHTGHGFTDFCSALCLA